MENATKSELSLPKWLNDEFLETALRSGENDDNIKVISSEIKRATDPGDNYGSDMLRATVQVERGTQKEERSLIIKTIRSDSSVVGEIFDMSSIFKLEINTFSIAHPALQKVLDKISMGTNQPFSAKLIYSQNEYPKRIIIMEDLKKQGFRLAERTLGLDLNHCRLVLRTIARYHAASVVVLQQDPKFMDVFLGSKEQDEKRFKTMDPFFKIFVKSCAKEAASWLPDQKERYADKLYELKDTALKTWFRALQFDERSFNVLTHGDLWANNMMFRYSDVTGEVEDVRFVDFQLSRWTSPVADLLYFFNSSVSPDVLENLDTLVEEYHGTLCNILSLLGYKHLQPSLQQINEDIARRGIFGVLAAITIRGFALADRSKVPDLREMLHNDGVNFSENYKTSMEKLLPLYGKWGWL